MSFTVPQDTVERLNTIFPKSTDRVKCSLILLGYDHDPTRAERTEVGAAIGKDIRTVELVLERLVAENLFASDLGSVPLWRVNEKNRLAQPSITPASAQTPKHPVDDTPKQSPDTDPELPIYPIEVSMDRKILSEVKQETETEAKTEKRKETESKVSGDKIDSKQNPAVKEAGVSVAIHSDAQLLELKRMKERQEGFETVVKAELGGIKELLQKTLDSSKLSSVASNAEVRVVSALKGQPKQPVADDPPEKPENSGPTANPNDPFFNMTKEEVIEFYENNPPPGRKLPGGLSETFVTAPKDTIRKIMIEVTTYTQMLYEKALADGAFEGTFSDFLNYAPAKYFEDRGLSLGWHKVERHPGRGLN